LFGLTERKAERGPLIFKSKELLGESGGAMIHRERISIPSMEKR
jgi:hypothetical protein